MRVIVTEGFLRGANESSNKSYILAFKKNSVSRSASVTIFFKLQIYEAIAAIF